MPVIPVTKIVRRPQRLRKIQDVHVPRNARAKLPRPILNALSVLMPACVCDVRSRREQKQA